MVICLIGVLVTEKVIINPPINIQLIVWILNQHCKLKFYHTDWLSYLNPKMGPRIEFNITCFDQVMRHQDRASQLRLEQDVELDKRFTPEQRQLLIQRAPLMAESTADLRRTKRKKGLPLDVREAIHEFTKEVGS